MKITRSMAALAVAGLTVLTSVCQAQPDVIVGDLPDVDNSYGLNGAKRMYAVGTTSCNLGTTPLTWVDCSSGSQCNIHPVITNNMYRLITASGSTRFEQVGQAWLKHGFCALQGTVCSSCTPGGSCDALFPGCSDPYSASLNGSPGGLGPKGEVNPVTGAFPYPWTFNGAGGSGAPAKRLEVATADLDAGIAAPGTLWFVSSMYVQPEDAAAHNNNNNESYRRVTVAAAPGYNLSLMDSTQRTKAAIYAWKDNDPTVTISFIDVPGDGRFIVAAKATNTGAATNPWHYEYAIQNLNSDRAGQAFSVPLPPSTTTANIGFHDVDYNNSDGLSTPQPYALTDWSGVASGSAVTWNTQTFAANAAANALRWDTIYNFRFDCNQPPAGGSATLTLFKPGSPTTAGVTTIIPSPDGTGHPLNDTCATALDISAGTTSFNNAGANTDGPDEPGACTAGSYTNIGADIWFRYTSNSCTSGPTTITTCGSTFDTKIAVYATCPTTSGTFVACNDDSSACGAGSLQSSLSFTAAANTAYLIRVGGYNALTGNGTLTITPPNCGPLPPPNDNCSAAIFLADNVAASGTTINATNDMAGTCGANTTGPDAWYAYRPVTTATVNVNTCGSYPGYDTVLSVYTGVCGALSILGCNDDSYNGGNNACGTGSGNFASGLDIPMTAGTTYLIRVAGYNNGAGNFTLRAIGGGGIVPPTNDNCAGRPGIGMGPTSFSNIDCNTDGPTHALCNNAGNNTITGDLWWNFPATFNGNLRIDTCSPQTNFDTKIAVYSGSGCTNFDARILACNDDDAVCGALRSVITLPVQAGNNYTIRVGGYAGATGSGVLTLTQVPSCGSADFNHDGDLGTDADIAAFFACLAGNCCPLCGSVDFNGDGDLGTDSDIAAFFRVLSGGSC